MKQMEKLASFLLALAMTLILSVSAFAASGVNDNSGTITVNKTIAGQTYTIYQILQLESYNAEDGAYAYKAASGWDAFVKSAGIKDVYLNVDAQGYVTWKEGASVADFAAAAQTYAKQNGLANQGSVKADSTTVTFTGLNLGYYLLDSSLGTLCSLDTTNPSVEINEKNAEPTNVKQVEEDSTGTLGSRNDADIGQRVKFVSTITIPVGSESVVFHDKMSAGLSLVWGTAGVDGTTVYTDAALKNALQDGNYSLTAKELDDGCTFEIDFANYLDLVKQDTTLYIVYYATVNENAVVGGAGNPNESWLSYGEDGKTTSVPSVTKTYTWEINVYKYAMVKAAEAGQADTEKALAKAEFILYKDVKNDDGSTTRYYVTAAAVEGGYRVTGWTTDETAAAKFVTPDNGKFAIKGLDSDTYYLKETTAPAGYNVLKDPVQVVIDENGAVTYGKDNTTAAPDVKILNQTGTELPSTGGIGTTIFYVAGSILVVAAVVLLITKKRMEKKD